MRAGNTLRTGGRVGLCLCLIELSSLCALTCGGCFGGEIPGSYVETVIRDSATGRGVQTSVVVVSLLYSTPWYFYVSGFDRTPFSEVQVDRIEYWDPQAPRIWGSRVRPWIGSPLCVVKNELPGIMYFAVGYYPGFTAEPEMKPVKAAWENDRAPVSVATHFATGDELLELAYRDRRSKTVELRPILVGEEGVGTGRVLKWNVLFVLRQSAFWEAIRAKYRWNDKREEIRLICRAMICAADALRKADEAYAWTNEERKVLSWCRDVANR